LKGNGFHRENSSGEPVASPFSQNEKLEAFLQAWVSVCVMKKMGSPGEAILTSPDPGQIGQPRRLAERNSPPRRRKCELRDLMGIPPCGQGHEADHRGCLAASMTPLIYDVAPDGAKFSRLAGLLSVFGRCRWPDFKESTNVITFTRNDAQ
jgi:hypothetical protein